VDIEMATIEPFITPVWQRLESTVLRFEAVHL